MNRIGSSRDLLRSRDCSSSQRVAGGQLRPHARLVAPTQRSRCRNSRPLIYTVTFLPRPVRKSRSTELSNRPDQLLPAMPLLFQTTIEPDFSASCSSCRAWCRRCDGGGGEVATSGGFAHRSVHVHRGLVGCRSAASVTAIPFELRPDVPTLAGAGAVRRNRGSRPLSLHRCRWCSQPWPRWTRAPATSSRRTPPPHPARATRVPRRDAGDTST